MIAADLVADLVAAVAPVADQLADVRWRDATAGERLAVRNGHVSTVCPVKAALDGDGEFQTTPTTAGPAAALTVLDRVLLGGLDPMRGAPAADPPSAFRATYQEQLDDWPWTWARDEASPEQRALLAAAANRRVSGIARMLSPWPPPAAGHIGMRLSWLHPERPLQLSTRADAVLGRRDGTHTLVVHLGGDHGAATRRRLAYDAVLEAVSLRRPPAAVRGLLPDAGRDWTIAVDDAVLAEGIAAAAAGARTALGAQRLVATGLVAQPGPACRYCAHRDRCEPGSTWLGGPGRLRHGFLAP